METKSNNIFLGNQLCYTARHGTSCCGSYTNFLQIYTVAHFCTTLIHHSLI